MEFVQHSQQMGDVPVLRPHVVIEDVERIDSDEKKRLDDIEMTAKLENDVTLRQQLMAKQQEILRLHQQELELKIARANALIDQQAKLFQKNSIKEAQVCTRNGHYYEACILNPTCPRIF